MITRSTLPRGETSQRRRQLILGCIALAAVITPIVVKQVWNLGDAANVVQIMSPALAALTALDFVNRPGQAGSSPSKQTPSAREDPPHARRGSPWAIAVAFTIVFAGVVVANLATGAFLSANGSHGPAPGEPHRHGEPHRTDEVRDLMAPGPRPAQERPVELSTKAGQGSVEIDWWPTSRVTCRWTRMESTPCWERS
jgi:hypothetical protein